MLRSSLVNETAHVLTWSWRHRFRREAMATANNSFTAITAVWSRFTECFREFL